MPVAARPEHAPTRGGLHESDELLLRRYGMGDLRARDTMAERHMPMARRLARRHRHSSEPIEDLEQVAYVGLLKTIDRYDPGVGTFEGYAVTTIRGELKRHFRDHGWVVHVPRPLQERYLLVSSALEAGTAALGRTPSVNELAERTGLAPDEVAEALDAASGYTPPSLDGPVGGDPGEVGRTLGDAVGRSEQGYETVEMGEAMAPAFHALPQREQRILKLRLAEDLTQSEIASQCGISQMHVSRLLRRSLTTLLAALHQERVPHRAGMALPSGNRRPPGKGERPALA